MSVWTLKGEAGKAIDATLRSPEALQANRLEVFFGSLEDDTLTWTVWLRDIAEIATLVPDYGQKISLFIDGTRYFTGHVIGRTPSFDAGRWGYSVVVAGPWYWLRNTTISTEMPDETTVVQERAAYLFNTGSPTTHINSLAARAISVGIPISLGSVATCFDVPRLSLREMSFGDALSEIMRLVVDGLIYFDYSGADGTLPALCMQRRDPASTVALTIYDLAVPSLNLRPRYDLKISEVSIKYAERETFNSIRATAFKSQSAGTATGSMPDRQILTVSGPELDTFLPLDLTDFVVVKSAPLHFGQALTLWHDLLKAGNTVVEVYTAQQSDVYNSADLLNGGLSGGGFVTTYYWPTDPLLIVTDSEGQEIPLSDWPYYLTKGEPKDWWEKDGIKSILARVTATCAASVVQDRDAEPPADPIWARILGAKKTSHEFTGGGIVKVRYVWQVTVSTVIPLVKTLWSTETTLIRQEDWGWFNPPAGFADNLLATQNWIPYEGEVPIVSDYDPLPNPVGSVLNITDWVPEAASMRAMISGYRVKPATGETTFTLGPPARHSFRDLVNRFRQSGADNIYYLDGPGDTGTPDETGGLLTGSILTESGVYEYNEDGTTIPFTEG